jgi:hypothetical protein
MRVAVLALRLAIVELKRIGGNKVDPGVLQTLKDAVSFLEIET